MIGYWQDTLVYLSVTVCTLVLRVGVEGWKLYCVPRRTIPIHFFRDFCCRVYHLATIVVGCIIQPQHTAKNQTAEISASGISMGSRITWPWLMQMQKFQWFSSAAVLYVLCSTIGFANNSWVFSSSNHAVLTCKCIFCRLWYRDIFYNWFLLMYFCSCYTFVKQNYQDATLIAVQFDHHIRNFTCGSRSSHVATETPQICHVWATVPRTTSSGATPLQCTQETATVCWRLLVLTRQDICALWLLLRVTLINDASD